MSVSEVVVQWALTASSPTSKVCGPPLGIERLARGRGTLLQSDARAFAFAPSDPTGDLKPSPPSLPASAERGGMMATNTRIEYGPATKGAQPRVSAKGRVCEAPGCTTILSIYNGLQVCSAHEIPRRRPATYNR